MVCLLMLRLFKPAKKVVKGTIFPGDSFSVSTASYAFESSIFPPSSWNRFCTLLHDFLPKEFWLTWQRKCSKTPRKCCLWICSGNLSYYNYLSLNLFTFLSSSMCYITLHIFIFVQFLIFIFLFQPFLKHFGNFFFVWRWILLSLLLLMLIIVIVQ